MRLLHPSFRRMDGAMPENRTNNSKTGSKRSLFRIVVAGCVFLLMAVVVARGRAEYPLLFHGRHGAVLTGLAPAVGLLLPRDIDLTEARGQLAAHFGHFSVGRRRYLDRFFDLYSLWLHSHILEHTPAHF